MKRETRIVSYTWGSAASLVAQPVASYGDALYDAAMSVNTPHPGNWWEYDAATLRSGVSADLRRWVKRRKHRHARQAACAHLRVLGA